MNAQFHPSLGGGNRHTSRPVLKSLLRVVTLLGLSSITAPGHAFDLAVENDITSKLAPHPGDSVVDLDLGRSVPVFALYRQATPSKHKGNIILFHDFGLHADWPRPIRELRKELPNAGWSTLSVQVPHTELNWRDIPFDDFIEEMRLRLQAAKNHFGADQGGPIVVLGQGYTATVLLNILTGNTADDFNAFIALSLPQINPPVAWGDSVKLLQQVRIPTLDIFAEADTFEVLSSVTDRYNSAKIAAKLIERNPKLRYSAKVQELTAKKKENVWYRQVKIANTDHLYNHKHAATTKAIWGWLDVFIENN
jgi:hypothetical protein